MVYTFFDTETSGLQKDADILSFSYMLSDENLDVFQAETLYFWKEGVTKWTQEAYEIHGLSIEFLRTHADEYERNLKKMYIALSYSVLVGYNSGYIGSDGLIHGYDYPLCLRLLRDNGYQTPKNVEFMDVMKLAEFRYHKRFKLQVLFDYLKLDREMAQIYCMAWFETAGRAHESCYDVVCTAMAFNKLYSEEEEEEEPKTVLRQSDNVTWYLYFSSTNELRSLMVLYEGEADEDFQSFSMEELMNKDMNVFEYLMSNPDAHMCTNEELLRFVNDREEGYTSV